MENNPLIERYVYDVIRRLPENDKGDVRRELTSAIYDMLPDQPDEARIIAALEKMGPPSALAEKYRQHPRCLISPAFYDEYIRVLHWVPPLVAVIAMTVTMIVEALVNPEQGAAQLVSHLLAAGIATGIEAALFAMAMITIGFAVADRTHQGKDLKRLGLNCEWSVKDLPSCPPPGRRGIPISESVVELVITVIFSAIFIHWCNGARANPVYAWGNRVSGLFSLSFLYACILAAAMTLTFSVAYSATKLIVRVWNPVVCAVGIVSGAAQAVVAVRLLLRRDMFSDEFIQLVNTIKEKTAEVNPAVSSGLTRWLAVDGRTGTLISLIIASIVIITLIECASILYKTLRRHKG